MMHVVTPYGRRGPSSRVRVYEWLDRVAEPTVLSDYVSHHNASPTAIARHPIVLLNAEHRLRRMADQRPERLLLHREASPLSRGAMERRLIASSSFSVYDFDDALQCDWGAGGVLRRLAPKAPKAQIAAATADRVIAGNPVLAEWAATQNRDVVVIPSCVAPEAYGRKTDYQLSDPPRLGWIGSAGNERYLAEVGPALLEVHRRTGARLTLVGTTRPTLGPLETMVDRVAWSEDVQHAVLRTLDIGLAPVPDNPYTRGKCGYKILQYAAVGLPAVASPVGVNGPILAELGLPAARGPDDWTDAVIALIESSAETRAVQGGRARDAAIAHYSYDAWLPKWAVAVGLPAPAR
jgi:glycosyltransferase involved in cell wall biosynthesis